MLTCFIQYFFNATKTHILASDITTFITFISVQYGLTILNHNSIMRACVIFNIKPHSCSRRVIESFCFVLYLLPLAVLTPVYLSIIDKHGTSPLNTSRYNQLIFKPLNIGLVVATEFFATLSDIFIIRKVLRALETENKVSSHSANFSGSNSVSTVRSIGETYLLGIPIDIWGNYASSSILFSSLYSYLHSTI